MVGWEGNGGDGGLGWDGVLFGMHVYGSGRALTAYRWAPTWTGWGLGTGVTLYVCRKRFGWWGVTSRPFALRQQAGDGSCVLLQSGAACPSSGREPERHATLHV